MQHYEDYLEHEGVKRKSGRYEYGSGENPYQHEPWYRGGQLNSKMVLEDPEAFYKYMRGERSRGKTDNEIAESLGISSGEFRNKRAVSRNYIKQQENAQILKYKDKGYSNVKIAEMLGITEGTVRNALKEPLNQRIEKTNKAANLLKNFVDKNTYVDVGPGTELNLDITDTRLKSALQQLKDEGYNVHKIYVNQMGGQNQQTTMSILVPPGVSYADLVNNQDKIHYLGEKVYDTNGDICSVGAVPPTSVSSDRIQINYAEDGGKDKDGIIELRRGVDDISLGKARYAQVRIAVDGDHYLKGMAMYSDDLPDGVDIRFNTNKHKGTPMIDRSGDKNASEVLKKMKDDPNNPFGASIKSEDSLVKAQKYYYDKDGNKQLSAINIVNEEGDWSKWSKNLASQFLSKQMTGVAKRQLDLTISDKKREYEEIMNLTNPTIKKKMLEEFASSCDANATELKASPFPKQATKVILPFTDLKENEIYAPHLKEGTNVCLVRFPHGGTFEIPKLVVKNRGTEASKIINNAQDAVGISAKTAERLSGADFDGDTVVVIPLSNKVKIRTSDPLEGLKNFDPKEAYPHYDGMKRMSAKEKGKQMGVVTNLITDMTLQGATPDELARAVRHSMVVIDAEKHYLNYKQSEKDNKIQELKDKYQSGGGASTLISRASSTVRVDEPRKEYGINSYNTNPETGEKITRLTERTYTKRTPYQGNTVIKKGSIVDSSGDIVKKYAYLDDGKTIVSGISNSSGITVNKGKVYKNGKLLEGSKVLTKYKTLGDIAVLKDDTVVSGVNSTRGISVNKGKVYKNGKLLENAFVVKSDRVVESEPAKATVEVSRMSQTNDAYTLTSGGSKNNPGTQMEGLYANFANQLKALANQARKSYLATETPKRDPSAAKKYEKEVKSLQTKLNIALKNAPKERAAQRLANQLYEAELKRDPEMDNEHKKKKKGQCLIVARNRVGAKKERIVVTDKEWEAIQNHAISDSKLQLILNNTKSDELKRRATPRVTKEMTPSMIALANTMSASGYTQADIAERLGVSSSTISKYLNN